MDFGDHTIKPKSDDNYKTELFDTMGFNMSDLKLRVLYFQDSTPTNVPCRELAFICFTFSACPRLKTIFERGTPQQTPIPF